MSERRKGHSKLIGRPLDENGSIELKTANPKLYTQSDLDRLVAEARLEEAQWWADRGNFSQGPTEIAIEDKRIAELRAAIQELRGGAK